MSGGLSKIRLSVLLHLGEDHGGDFLGVLNTKTLEKVSKNMSSYAYTFAEFSSVLDLDGVPLTLLHNLGGPSNALWLLKLNPRKGEA